MSDERLKVLEESVAYLTKSIEELKKIRILEIHQHYYWDYESIKAVLDKYKEGY